MQDLESRWARLEQEIRLEHLADDRRSDRHNTRTY